MPTKTGKPKKPKYKHGQMLYSYLNKSKKRPVTYIHLSDDPNFSHSYKLSLLDDDGYSYSSKYINEESLSRKPLKD